MARPLKQGIDYFSFDVDFFEDEKIEPISGEFGIKGEIIVIRLLCAVYRNGYFAMWNEQLKMTLANRCKVSSDLIEQVVSRLVKWGFVDESLFNSAKIITSKGIQKRFQEATRKRKYDYSSLDYWLLEAKKHVSSADNPRIEEFIPPKTPQSKVKESKGKYITIFFKGEERLIFSSLESLLNEILEDEACIEDLQRSAGSPYPTSEEIKEKVKEFFVKLTVDGESEKERKSAIYHFKSWINREQDKKEIKENKANLGLGEFIQDGKRFYGKVKPVEVPMDMPPRPSDRHYFNLSLKQWNV